MPELPEVETTRRGLLPHMLGRRIAKVTVHRADLRFPVPKDFARRVAGKKITGLRRRAKYLLLDLDSGESILIHLGMSGSLRVVEAEGYIPRKHDHVHFTMGDGTRIAFHDPRRFGLVDLIAKGRESDNKLLMHLGPEPLSAAFNKHYLSAALAKRKGPIKPVLMDQRLVVGVGNIYASESLFLSRIDPRMRADKAAKHAEAIVRAIKATLKKAIRHGGSTLRDYVNANGRAGDFQDGFHVYERARKPCFVCESMITTLTQSGRATYYCPACQRKR